MNGQLAVGGEHFDTLATWPLVRKAHLIVDTGPVNGVLNPGRNVQRKEMLKGY